MNNEKDEECKALEDRLLDIVDEAMRVEDAACGKIRVAERDSGMLTIRAQRGYSERFLQSYGTVDEKDEMPSARAARLRRRVTVPDLAQDPARPYARAARDDGLKSMQTTPIVSPDGRLLGTLSTHFSRLHQTSTLGGMVLDYCADKAAAIIAKLVRKG